jgi:DNA-binding transcriptional MocR family regulator
MPEEQRAELGTALRRSGTIPIVDETMQDMALDGDVTMPPPMAAFVPDSITLGSASKAFWGGLRLGWLRAPDGRVGSLLSSRLSLDLGAPLFEQIVLTHLLRERDQVLAHHREQLVASRDALAGALRDRLPDWRFVLPEGGLALWCELPEPLSSALTAAAETEKVLLAPGPSFAPEGGLERFLRIPYTKRPEELTEAVDRLETAWTAAQRNRSAAGRRAPLVA